MTKAEYIDFVIHGITGGKRVDSQFRRYHPKIVAFAIEHAMGEIFHDLFREDPSQLDLFAKIYVDQAVPYDAAYRSMSVSLPAPLVQIKGNEGVRWIVDKTKPQEKMIALSKDGAFNLHSLYANRIDDRPSFYITGQKVILSGFTKGAVVASTATTLTNLYYYQVDGNGSVSYGTGTYYNGEVFAGVTGTVLSLTGFTGMLWRVMPPTQVAMGLIVPISSLADTDQVIIPSGQNRAILTFVKAYFNDLGFQDITNDSKSDR